jgi:hypothetical protein
MYEHNGEKYFIFDSHLHFWDASPANWVKGHEEYAKGWIECFHAYQGLGPAETHWPLEKFQKYTLDDFEEIMSTHYGRMVVLDDRVLLFANPEDAAEYIGFDLQPVQ